MLIPLFLSWVVLGIEPVVLYAVLCKLTKFAVSDLWPTKPKAVTI